MKMEQIKSINVIACEQADREEVIRDQSKSEWDENIEYHNREYHN